MTRILKEKKKKKLGRIFSALSMEITLQKESDARAD